MLALTLTLGDPYLFVKNIANIPFVRAAKAPVPTISIKVKKEETLLSFKLV